MQQEKIDLMLRNIQKRADFWANDPGPSFPFWLFLKVLWRILKGEGPVRIQLHPPYSITPR